MKIAVLPVIAVLCLSAAEAVQAEPPSGTTAVIADFAWLAGVWRADALGGRLENVFQRPHNGEVLCTLTVEKAGKIVRYELCAIREQAGQLAFQVAAFGPDMTPIDPVPTRTLLSATDRQAKFNGIAFKRTGRNSMTVTLEIPTPQGATNTAIMNYTRVLTYANP